MSARPVLTALMLATLRRTADEGEIDAFGIDPKERNRLWALRDKGLVKVSGGRFAITQKGTEYLAWRGPR